MITTTDGRILRLMLRAADEGGYAVPMFNYTDIWDMSAIISAAIELRAPVMFACIPKTLQVLDVEVLGAAGVAQMQKSKTGTLVHHLDHSNELELCMKAINCGFPSVMIDASMHPLEENIKLVKQVVDYAHPRNVFVEAEIGRIKGRDYEGTYLGDDFLVKVPDAVELVERTGVDSLAVGIGTAHGFYEGKPEINFERLAEVNEAVDIPLVLHGGTGIPEEDVRKAIKNGINKINVGTQIRYTYLQATCDEIMRQTPNNHTSEIKREVMKVVKEEVKKWICICMADGKA